MPSPPDSRDLPLAFFVALFLFGIYMLTFDGTLHSSDGLSMLAVAESLAKHGELDTRQVENWENVALGTNGKPYTVFPLGPSLVMVPVLALALAVPHLGLTQTVMVLMPLASALSGLYLYLSARRLGYAPHVGIAVTLLAGLTTVTWLRSRDLVADPLILLSFGATFYYALAYRQEKKLSQAIFAGLALGAAILFKSSNPALVPFFGWYIGAKGFRGVAWRALLAFLLPAVLAVLTIAGYNFWRFGDPLDSGHRGTITFSTPVWIGVVGNLISPYKSIFLYTPLFMLIPFTFKKMWQKHPSEAALIVALLVTHLLIFGGWHDWGGGRNWGPRYLAALSGLLTLLLLPFIEQAFAPRQRRAGAILLIFSLISFGMQIVGLSARDNAFLGAANYWTKPPHLSYFGELTWDKPEQWPIWGHLLLLNANQIPTLWRWQWEGLARFDGPTLLAALTIVGLGAAGVWLNYGRRQVSMLWPGGAWVFAWCCVGLMLWRGYDDPRSIKRAAEGQKLWPAYSDLMAQLPALVSPGDALIFTDRRFDFYLLDLERSTARRYLLSKDTQPQILETVPRLLREDLSAAGGRIWLVTDDLDNRQLAYAVELWLREYGQPGEHYRFGESLQLTAFTPDFAGRWPAIPPQPQLAGLVEPKDYTFDGIAALLGWDAPSTLKAGQTYPIKLYWIYQGKAAEDRFFVRLLAAEGTPTLEVFTTPRPGSRLIPGQMIIEEATLTLPTDFLPGRYRLQIGLTTPAVEAGALIFPLPAEITGIQITP